MNKVRKSQRARIGKRQKKNDRNADKSNDINISPTSSNISSHFVWAIIKETDDNKKVESCLIAID